MRDIEIRAHEAQKHLKEQKEQDIKDYINWDDFYKQDYWDRYVFTMWWYDQRGTSLPIDLQKLREVYKWIEDNFNKFIPWIMKSLEEEWFSGTIDDIFILDQEAKWFLNGRLIENLWDLYYNTLSDFLEELYNITWNDKIKRASEKIATAWKISEPYVDKNNPPKKHENAELEVRVVWWIKSIAKEIWNWDIAWFWEFLLALSKKIWNDGEKDSNRPSIWKDWVVDEMQKRTKLATALFEASLLLKEVATWLQKKD